MSAEKTERPLNEFQVTDPDLAAAIYRLATEMPGSIKLVVSGHTTPDCTIQFITEDHGMRWLRTTITTKDGHFLPSVRPTDINDLRSKGRTVDGV